MLKSLLVDLKRYTENGKFAFYEPSVCLVIMFRICQSVSKLPPIFKIPLLTLLNPLYLFLQISLGIVLPKSTSIGKGLRIYHYSCIVINPKTVIGENCSLRHGVTIGNRKSNDDCPVIGNNCNIGAGAKILGNIKIGDNVSIGANAVVLSDVPDNSIAVGIPARIISKKDHRL